MRNNDLISIIVTCFNNGPYLTECLQSIQRQTYQNYEVLLINDGSTDNSLEIMTQFAENDKRFKIFNVEHIGFPLAKNIGLDNAKGKYIIFLDSDDSAYPYWLQLLYEIAIDTNADITTCLYDKYTEKKAIETPLSKLVYSLPIEEFDFFKMSLLFHSTCLSYMWNKLIKAELYRGLRHTDQIALSDVSIMYKIFDRANKIVQLKIPMVHYRQHNNSMTVTSRLRGEEYTLFRLNLFKDVLHYVFYKYPQARYVTQIVLKQELHYAKEALKEQFNEKVSLDDVQDILSAKTIHYLI